MAALWPFCSRHPRLSHNSGVTWFPYYRLHVATTKGLSFRLHVIHLLRSMDGKGSLVLSVVLLSWHAKTSHLYGYDGHSSILRILLRLAFNDASWQRLRKRHNSLMKESVVRALVVSRSMVRDERHVQRTTCNEFPDVVLTTELPAIIQ